MPSRIAGFRKRLTNHDPLIGTWVKTPSPITAEILGLSDRILVMREGRLAGEFAGVLADEESLLACAAGIDLQR